MSGKRIWNGTAEEYRVLHEQEMRQRFMQTMDIWRDLSAPVSSPMPQSLQVVRSWPEATGGKVPPRFEAAYVERPVSVEVKPAFQPPAWYAEQARWLAQRLEAIGFRVVRVVKSTVTLERGAERVKLMIGPAPISCISGANQKGADDGGIGEGGNEAHVLPVAAGCQRTSADRE